MSAVFQAHDAHITREYLEECFELTPFGFVWKLRPLRHFTKQSSQTHANKHAGYFAGGRHPEGYWKIKLDRRIYGAQTLLWVWHFGAIPSGLIVDHIDRDPANNKLSNLRLVSRREGNGRNRAKMRNNTSGHPGVYLRPNGRWMAMISHGAGMHSLGCYGTFDEALAVRKEAERAKGYDPTHGEEFSKLTGLRRRARA